LATDSGQSSGVAAASSLSAMTDRAVRRELDRYLTAIGAYLPVRFCRTIIWLRKPSRLPLRAAVSVLLIAGGFLSFLPVLGLWMLPLGLIMISQDLPFLRRPLLRAFRWTDRKWQGWRNSRAKLAS
jgi:hypothetical protein